MENFKSYYGRKEIGPFHPKFSSIMGPNGSGKSNLIDSLVFLFGKKASSIRLKNLKELIHNSKKYPDCEKAFVEVIFQKIEEDSNKNITYLDNTEFSLKRTINKKNVSNYYIDNQKSNLSDINKKLNENNIDLKNNRFIILQGEIEEISLMKNKSGNYNNPGFLEYLDDMIGTIKYLDEIDNLKNNYEELNLKKMEKSNLLMNFEKEIDILRISNDKAIYYLEKEKYVFRLRNFDIHRKIFEVRKKLFTIQEDLSENKNAMKSLENRIRRKKTENEEKLNFRKNLKNQKKEQEEKINILTKKNKTDETKYNNINYELITIIKEFSNYKKHDIILDEKISKVIDFYGELLIKIPEKKNILEIKKKDLSEIRKKIEKLEPLYLNRICDIRKEINLNEKKSIENISKEQSLKENLYDLKENYNNYFYKNIENKKKLEEIDKDLNHLQNKQLENEESLKNLKEKERLSKEELDKNKKNEQELSIKRLDNKRNIKKLLKLKDEIEYNSKYKKKHENILRALLEGQKKGELSGIIGRVGDLAKIDPILEIAVCSFAKNNLNKIVVNTLKNGQKAIRYLKKNKIGTISFYVLEKIKYFNPKIKFLAPKFSERIFDLLEISEKTYYSLFYLIFKNTLITENISRARNIAFSKNKRFNVVTHKGEIIEKSGLFRSEGDEKIRGLIKIKNSDFIEEDINDNENIVNKIKIFKKQLDDLEKKSNFFSDFIYEKKKLLGKIIREKKKIEVQINLDVFDFESLINSRLNLNLEISDNNNKFEKLNYHEKLKLYNSEIQKIELIKQNLNNIKIKLENKLDIIYEKDIKDLKIKYKLIKNEIFTMNEEIIFLEARLNNLKIEEKKFLKEKSNLSEEIKNIDLQIKHLNQKKEKIIKESQENNREFNKLNDELDNINVKFDETESFFSDLKKFMFNLKKEYRKIKKREEEIFNKRSKINYEISVKKEKLEELRENYKNILSDYDFLSDLEDIKKIDILIKIEDDCEEDILKNVIKDIKENYLDTELETLSELFPEIKKSLKKNELKLERLKPNLNIIKEFREKLKTYKEKQNNLKNLQIQLTEAQEKFYNLRNKRIKEFLIGFEIISKKLKETYSFLTKGGDADIELIDSLDPYSEGIEFTVRPPKKTWKNISKLSGGEKTLSSLSLIYAFHFYKPNCIYLMDEIDAALDYRNVKIVSQFIKEKAENAQFLVVSLRNDMFDSADCLVGVYKVEDVSAFMVLDVKRVGEIIGLEDRRKENILTI